MRKGARHLAQAGMKYALSRRRVRRLEIQSSGPKQLVGTKAIVSWLGLISSDQDKVRAKEPTALKPATTAAMHQEAQGDDQHGHKAAWGAMLAGAALSLYGWTRRSASGVALGVAGGAIALKAASAGPIADLVGTETSVRRSVIILRTAEDIYRLWNETETIPQWMEHVRSVKRLDRNRMLWSRLHPEA